MTVLAVALFGGNYENAIKANKAGDKKKAQELFMKSADEGNADGQIVLAMMYFGEKKINLAYKYLEMSANQGNTQAQFLLGSNYANGVGVKQDYKKAIKYLEQANGKGDSKVPLMLGLLYIMGGNGIEQDKIKTYQYWNEAAKQGNAQAEKNLGFLCKDNPAICKQ